jgi:hypothetical protein
MNERNPYAEVIADLKKQRDHLDILIAGLEARAGSAAAVAGEITDIGPTTFYGMKIGEAALKYLRLVKRPQSAPEIAKAIEEGGLAHESKTFGNTVYATLNRDHERKGEIIRLPGRKWGLASDYPEAARRRSAENSNKKNGDGGNETTPTAPEASTNEPEQPSEQSPTAASS